MAERGRRGTGPGRGERADKAASTRGRRASATARARSGRSGTADRGQGRAGHNASTAETNTTAGEQARVLARGRREKQADRTILGLSTGRAAILAIVVAALALTLAVPLRTYFTQRSEAAQVTAQRRQLEVEVTALQARRAQQQDPAYVRAQARERLRLVMPGDIPYLVQLPGADQPAADQRTAQRRTTGSWYTNLWQSISGRSK